MTTHSDIRTFLTVDLGRAMDGVGNADSLLEAGVLDSLGVMRLVAFLEERLGVSITEDEMMPENFDSVDAIVEFVAQKANARSV